MRPTFNQSKKNQMQRLGNSTLLCACLLLGCMLHAQSPQFTVSGADSVKVRMSQLLVNVRIVGNIAYTTAEMHFTNKTARPMEAELLFPLPEGVTVSRYAIDINGNMREAVPVDKSKGKQVFEAIEHRRVDPGLLEKVEGNNFKTRIYPIPSNGERVVIIGYEQELSRADANHLAYQLVSKYPTKLDKFEVMLTILGSALAPTIIEDGNESPVSELQQTNQWTHTYQSAMNKTNYKPADSFMVKIPINQEIPAVLTQSVGGQHYFYANAFVESKKMQRQKPASIGLIWDVSLSCRKRDLAKETQLLDSYFKALQNTSVTLYTLGYVFEKKHVYQIINGNWSALKAALESLKYDGGTRFSELKFTNHDAYIVSTDGLSSLSDNELAKTTKPVYMMTSLVSADYTLMNDVAIKSGGAFINLNKTNNAAALDKLMYTGLKFLGVKDNFSVAEVFPPIGTSVDGSFSIAGISLKDKNELTLRFGYGSAVILEKTITLDTALQNTTAVAIEKLWAQKKIAGLELQYQKNETEIELTGRKYGIITRNTSLIVLETVADYIAYDIMPPAELRDEFDRLSKQQRESRLAQQRSNWENVEKYHNELQAWWNKDLKYVMPKPKYTSSRVRPRNATSQTPRQDRTGTGQEMRILGTVSDNVGPLPGANVLIQGTGIGVRTDFNGYYSLNARRGDVLVFSFIGLDDSAVRITNRNVYNVRMREGNVNLSEVVVTAMGVKREKRALGYAVAKVEETSVSRNLSGKAAGVAADAALEYENRDDSQETDKDENLDHETVSARINTEKWNPDRIYLKILEAAPETKKYQAYLELRTDHEQNPSFYFDVANYFYNKGNRPRALLVLSNIADLGLENHQLYKSLTYVLRQWEAYDDALFTAKQLVAWRAHEPQSHRDLALALEDNTKYQAAFDELVSALEVNYYGEMAGQYQGVEDIILMDMNRMVAQHKGIKTGKLDAKYLGKMPVGIRIVLNWNQMDTDIDLHVVEPSGEECYYAHRDTKAGARFSKDFTQGYGPEQYLLRHAMNGKYRIKTNYFGESALTENGPATVMVEIYTTKNGVTKRELQTIQLGKIKENQNLAMLTID